MDVTSTTSFYFIYYLNGSISQDQILRNLDNLFETKCDNNNGVFTLSGDQEQINGEEVPAPVQVHV